MTAPAAISAQLVDIRNVGMHKCIKLTIHVPVEQAALVTQAFGWPTMAEPVPIALARLTNSAAGRNGEAQSYSPPDNDALPQPRRKFTSLPLPQQAALLCADAVFRAFLRENYSWNASNEEDAAEWIRLEFGINSRRELRADNAAGKSFIGVREKFINWKLAETH
jgi:hypothetical protein